MIIGKRKRESWKKIFDRKALADKELGTKFARPPILSPYAAMGWVNPLQPFRSEKATPYLPYEDTIDDYAGILYAENTGWFYPSWLVFAIHHY